jgi:hypothetical protein
MGVTWTGRMQSQRQQHYALSQQLCYVGERHTALDSIPFVRKRLQCLAWRLCSTDCTAVD